MEGLNLDAVLGDEDVQPVAETVEAPEPQPEDKPAQPRGPDGKFAPKGEEDGSPPEPVDDKAKGLEAGIAAERRKRQEWESRYGSLSAELETLKQQLQSLQAPKEPPAPPPSLWDDEQGWQQHFGGQVVSTAVEQATYQAKLNTSEIIARQAHEDFGDVWEPMNAFLRENPAVAQKVAAEAHPWGAAYKAFKSHQTMQELAATDISDLEAKIEARVRERLAAEAQQQPQPQVLPTSLADAQSARGAVAPGSGPLSLEAILGR